MQRRLAGLIGHPQDEEMDLRRLAPGALAIIALILQLAILGKQVVYPLGEAVWSLRGRSAIERSGELAFSTEFTNYILFLRREIPSRARVVLPPMSEEAVLGNMGMMQFYLFPREIVNCPDGEALPECVRSMGGPDTYILSTAGFPPPDALPEGKSLRSHGQRLGVYEPAE